MDVRQNARLAMHSRALLVERVLWSRPKARGAAEFGISVKHQQARGSLPDQGSLGFALPFPPAATLPEGDRPRA